MKYEQLELEGLYVPDPDGRGSNCSIRRIIPDRDVHTMVFQLRIMILVFCSGMFVIACNCKIISSLVIIDCNNLMPTI